jgi:hypothetical protein
MNTNTKIRRNMPNPVPVSNDLITQKRFEVILNATTTTFTVSPKALVDTITGTSSIWDKVQFHSFDVFSNVTVSVGAGIEDNRYTPISAQLENPGSGYFGDHASAYSDAVGTFRRAHVGFTPNDLYRSTWMDSTDTSPILTITATATTGTNTNCLLQFVAILRSTEGSPTGEAGSASRPVRFDVKPSDASARRVTDIFVKDPLTGVKLSDVECV